MEIKTTEEIHDTVCVAVCFKDEKKWMDVDDVTTILLKIKGRLRGYSCGHHIQLMKQIDNQLKRFAK